MTTFHTLRVASGLYASLSGPSFSGLKLVSLSTCSRGLSQIHTPANASTSKTAPQKPTQMKVVRERPSSSSSEGRSYSKKLLDTSISSRKGVLKLDSKPTPNPILAKPNYPPRPKSRPVVTPPQYKSHRERIKNKFPEGWSPPRTISREAMEVLRALHAEDPVQYRTPVLANKFKISPEAVSRILKSNWRPSPERAAQLIARENRNKDKWIAEKIRAERAESTRSLKGRLDIVEKAQGKDKLTMK